MKHLTRGILTTLELKELKDRGLILEEFDFNIMNSSSFSYFAAKKQQYLCREILSCPDSCLG